MRKIFTSALLFIILSSTFCIESYAQKWRTKDSEYFPRNEIYVQYGTPTVIELATTISNPTISKDKEADTKNHLFSGVAGLGYNFSITPALSVGIYGGYGYSSADIYARDVNSEDKFKAMYNSSISNFSGQLSGHWTYFQSGSLECSSGVYLGISYLDESLTPLGSFDPNEPRFPKEKDIFKLAYHLTAVKLRYGEIIGGFVELGFGYRGLVNVGLSIKI